MLKRKDIPQWIGGKDDLHNVVAVTEAQATLTQGEKGGGRNERCKCKCHVNIL